MNVKKKNRICISPLLIMGLFLIITHSCKKEEEILAPVLTTSPISEITKTTATCGGNISSDGGATITVRGVCWSTLTNPTIADSKTTDSTGIGAYTSSIDGLAVGTTYFVRAYAINKIGTSYGNEINFSTNQATIPTISTIAVSSVTSTTANSGGNIISDGGSAIIARGVCWSMSGEPTIDSSKTTDIIGIGEFTSNVIDLAASTDYNIRAYATNSKGTAYGNLVTFTTSIATVPTISTIAVSSITKTTAESGGIITSDGGSPVTDRGVCWSTTNNPIVTGSHTSNSNGEGTFTSSIVELTKNTIYYVRAYATNNAGTIYGNEVSFTTSTDILDGLNSETGLGSNLGNFVPISVIGDQIWAWSFYGYMKVEGYFSGVFYNNEDWLVSPAMNFTEYTDLILKFDHVARYFGDVVGSNANMKAKISIWVSTSSDGTAIVPSQWIQLSLSELVYPSGTDWTFVSSGPLNLTAYKGMSNVRIAFKYLSSSSDGYAGAWEVKNVNVYANK